MLLHGASCASHDTVNHLIRITEAPPATTSGCERRLADVVYDLDQHLCRADLHRLVEIDQFGVNRSHGHEEDSNGEDQSHLDARR